MSNQGSPKREPHWVVVMLVGLVAASLITWLGINDWRFPWVSPSAPAPGSSTVTEPNQPPAGGGDAVPNLTLGLSPASIPLDGSAFARIEVSGGTPDAFLDVEIQHPSYVEGGACSRIDPAKPCNLVYAGGDVVDREGEFSMLFPDPPGIQLYSGLYHVMIRDRHTGVILEADLAVN